MLAKERFQIFPINVAILPIVYRIERFLDIEALSGIHLLLEFFGHAIQRNLLLEKPSELRLHVRVEIVMP